MELWRRAANPWNQEVLIGISWNLMWAAAIAGVLFVVGHTLWAWRGSHAHVGEDGMPSEPTGIPARILRHTFSARAFHWLMALSMFALLITAFFPVLGIQFAWVQIHWIAGVVLILTVVYHVIHATFWQDLWSMWIGREDVQVATTEVKRFLGQEQPEGPKAAKYPLDHKLYHHAIVVVTFAAIITGILMMFRVDTWFWARNPYILGDRMWGFVYVAHGPLRRSAHYARHLAHLLRDPTREVVDHDVHDQRVRGPEGLHRAPRPGPVDGRRDDSDVVRDWRRGHGSPRDQRASGAGAVRIVLDASIPHRTASSGPA